MTSSSSDERRRPRVRRAPRAVTNDVDDAAFLASSYGLTPDDWQEDVLESWLGRRRDGRWSAASCGVAVPRQNGKNALIEIRELFGMVMLGERFLHTAHEVKTARKAFIRISSFFENVRQFPELAALVKEIRKTNGQEAVILTNGGAVEFIARSKGSGRGFTVDVLVCDEAQDLQAEEMAALLPTISAAPSGNPQLILAGTPPKIDGTKGEVFRTMRADGEANRDPRLAWSDFGVADGPMPDIEDRKLWFACNPALGNRLNVAEVERELAVLKSSPEDFAAERLGWWGDPARSSQSAFGPGAWERCADEDAPQVPDVLGVAVSLDRSHTSIGAAGMFDDRVIVGEVKRDTGVGWAVAELKRIQAERGCKVAVDPAGPTKDLIVALRAAGVEVIEVRLPDACASIFDAANEDRLRHPNHHELNQAVTGAAKRDVGDLWAWARKKSTSDISMLEAVTVAAKAALDGNATAYDPLDSIY